MEYRVRDMLACKYMADKVGQEFTWNISGMIEKWFFVELPDYNPDEMCIESFDQTKKLHFWSEVSVRLIDIDTSRMRLEFELI